MVRQSMAVSRAVSVEKRKASGDRMAETRTRDTSGGTGSVAEHAAPLLELIFVNLTAGEALLEDVERCAARRRLVRRRRPLPGAAEPAGE